MAPISPVPSRTWPALSNASDGADDRTGLGGDRGVRWLPRFGRLAVGITACGLLLHAAGLVTRGIAADRVPWGNMYEFIIAVTLVCSIGWMILVLRRPAVRPMGLVVTLVLVVLLGVDLIVLRHRRRAARTGAELVLAEDPRHAGDHRVRHASWSGSAPPRFTWSGPATRSAWRRSSRSASRTRWGRGCRWRRAWSGSTFRIHAFAFPIWTLAIMCGAIWAEAAWGRYWGWDPKETWSFIAWVVYAGYLHARATPSVKRNVATLLAVAGFAVMMVNLFVINFVVSGLHSYAGVG